MTYPNSIIECNGSTLSLIKQDGLKYLMVQGLSEVFNAFAGDTVAEGKKRCPLTNANAKALQKYLSYVAPSSHKGHPFTLGLGDRLGLASPGHIRLVKDMDIFPIFAQQSIRELNLTHRTYEDVMSSAIWAVFQEGYKKGWGADGDHLKNREEVRMALDAGFTMITLDCSEHMPNGLGAVVEFAAAIYNEFIKGSEIDFELSIDETTKTTSPEDHRFVASELKKQGVLITSLAPRFCGEFQKGIDYIGDIGEFEKEFAEHASLAAEYGYKLSVHSGSDKFKVFPAVFKHSNKNVHLKTAGTNWLEALRVIAQKEPALFRHIFIMAMYCLPDAKRYYVITENTGNIPDIEKLSDDELPGLLNKNDPRQVLHITYGPVLDEYKKEIYDALNKNEEGYYSALEVHIKKHIYINSEFGIRNSE